MRRGPFALLLVTAAACAFAAHVVLSNHRAMQRRHALEPVPIAAATDPGAAARGKALADVTGCTDCHRDDLRGGPFIDEGWLHGRYHASNLTLVAAKSSDEDLARIVRLGVKPDGRGVVAMPSFGFVRLTDAEMSDLLAFIRSRPPGGEVQPPHHVGPLDQWDLWRGDKLRLAVDYVATERVKDPREIPGHEAGRHLARIVCAECHGGDLRGNGWDSGAPDLVVAASYDLQAFTRLLREGVPLGGRKLGLMGRVARDRLRKLSDDQVAQLHAYLVARASLP